MSIKAYACKRKYPWNLARMPSHTPMAEDALQLVAARFAVLAEPMRLRLIQALFEGEKNVTQLVEITGGTQTNVSRHLQTLTTAHILARRREGAQVFYRIGDPTIPKLCQLVCNGLEKTLSKQVGHFSNE